MIEVCCGGGVSRLQEDIDSVRCGKNRVLPQEIDKRGQGKRDRGGKQ